MTDTTDTPALTIMQSLTEVAAEVKTETGITYRQVDTWCRAGYIHAIPYRTGIHSHEPATDSKQGRLRRLPDREADVLRLMARLVTAGLYPATAAKAARDFTTTGRAISPLTADVHILLTNRADGA